MYKLHPVLVDLGSADSENKDTRKIIYLQYITLFTHEHRSTRLRLICLSGFTIYYSGSQWKTEIIDNTWSIHYEKHGVVTHYYTFLVLIIYIINLAMYKIYIVALDNFVPF